MIYKNQSYEISKKKVTIPIKLMTDKYDKSYNVFINKVKEKMEVSDYTDTINLGIIIRYNREAGNLVGISMCFYFQNKTNLDTFKFEFETIEGFNVSEVELNKYKTSFEHKIQQHSFDFLYTIKHIDER